MTIRSEPAKIWNAISIDDSNDITVPCEALWVGTAGTLVVRDLQGNDETFLGVAAGSVVPIGPKRILTGTTAGGIIALGQKPII